jgi:uncharacterized RDD family membrane protein YckC
MSTDQPPSGPGEPSEERPPTPPAEGEAGRGGSPYDSVPPPFGGGVYGGGPLVGMPPLANRGKRLVARIIDGLLIGIPVSLIMWLLIGAYDPANVNYVGRNAAVGGVTMLVYLVYEGLMLTRSGQTVGKKLMNIRVAMLDNGAVPAGSPGWIRAGIYTFSAAASLFLGCFGSLIWLADVLWCTWDQPYHQCLHDKAVRTVVVETR